jgi:hypothetical protein
MRTSAALLLGAALLVACGGSGSGGGGTVNPPTVQPSNTAVSGGTSCGASLVDSALFAQLRYATDPRTLWFAGQYVPYSGGSVSAMGLAEFPIDPRSFTDPNHPTWP